MTNTYTISFKIGRVKVKDIGIHNMATKLTFEMTLTVTLTL